jgi:hypothetical protein
VGKAGRIASSVALYSPSTISSTTAQSNLANTISNAGQATPPQPRSTPFSPHGSAGLSAVSPRHGFRTDSVCDRQVLHALIADFMQHLYPIIPVFHSPSFLQSLHTARDADDPHFFGLLLALAAYTVACLPHKFREYQNRSDMPRLRYTSRLSMIDDCYATAIGARSPRYFDEVSHIKWAVAYLFYLGYHHIGHLNKSRMCEAECNLFSRLLELHRAGSYVGLNCIETQLRKKAFWLMFYTYVHLQFANFRKERVCFIDCSILHEVDMEFLLPVAQDDEYITESSYGDVDESKPCLAAGLIWRSKVFWCAVRNVHPGAQTTGRSRARMAHCHCTWLIDPEGYVSHVKGRLFDLKYVLDSAPWYLRHWVQEISEPGANGRVRTPEAAANFNQQIQGVRADIHVTHVWLQSIMMDHLEDISSVTSPAQMTLSSPASTSTASPFSSRDYAGSRQQAATLSEWTQREDLCRQLLQVLYSAPSVSLESLGTVLVYKVRDVAVKLLSCPYSDSDVPHSASSEGAAGRAKSYLEDFTRKLEELDNAEVLLNSHVLQSWTDTDRNQQNGVNHW